MPNKTIEDFAYQIKDYMRGAEVVEGKNHAYSQENNAVIATIENGKSYKVRWTGSATVTLKKNSASGTEVTSGSTSPLSFTADSDFDLYFGSSADVTEIMVYDGNDTSDTYEPYYVPVKDSMFTRSEQGVLGAKNLVKTTTSTTSVGGLTFTRNSDGTYTIGAGTANADIRFTLNTAQDMIDCLKAYKGKNVKVSGAPVGSDATYNHLTFTGLEADGIGINDIGSGNTATISNSIETFSNVYIRIWVKSGTVISTDRTFKPMITLAEDTLSDYDHYQPYAMTNRELTEVEDVTSLFTVVAGSGAQINSGWSKVTKCGKCINGSLRFTLPSTVTENAGIIEFPSSLNPASFPSGGMMPLCSLVETWTGAIKGALSISSSRLVVNSNTWTAEAVVFANFTYYTK